MMWEDERYVRLYTRDTVDWDMWPWEARALFPLILRKVDRAGVLDLGKHGARGLATIVKLPFTVTEDGLAALIEDGCVCIRDTKLIMRNYLTAQEATQSDKARKRAERERARSMALGAELVTMRDAESQVVTNRDPESQVVTKCHENSEPVTPCRAVPSHAVPSRTMITGTAAGAALPGDAAPAGESPVKPTRAKGLRGTRLPANWTPSDETQAWARAQGIADPLGVLEEFRDFWAGVPGARGLKLDWEATYRNRLRQVSEHRLVTGRRYANGAPRHVQSGENRAWIVPEDMP